MNVPALRFLWLAVRRIRSRPGLTLLSLLSIILSVATIVSIPVFSQGVSYLVLQEELKKLGEITRRPPLAVRFYYVSSTEYSLDLQTVHDLEQRFARIVIDSVGLPIAHKVTLVDSPSLAMRSVPEDRRFEDTENGDIKRNMRLTVLSPAKDFIEIVDGQPFGESSQSTDQEGAGDGDRQRLPAWPHAAMVEEMGLQVGEIYDLAEAGTGRTVPIYIAGIWRERNQGSLHWNGISVDINSDFLVTAADYEALAQPVFAKRTQFAYWFFVPDGQALTLERADAAARGLELVPSTVDLILPATRMDVSPLEPLSLYLQRQASLTALLVGFGLPTLGLLLYFLSLVSTDL